MGNKDLHIDITNEKLLIERCVEDDRAYQKAFYEKFAPKMYGVCKNYAENRDEAMDFLQDGFISVFRNLQKFRFEGSLEGGVRRIIVFRTIEALRKKKRYQEVIGQLEEDAVVEQEAFEFEASISSGEKIRTLVNDLPKKAGLVLKLYAIEGYTHAEISEILEISVGTSKSQLNRARKLMRVALTS